MEKVYLYCESVVLTVNLGEKTVWPSLSFMRSQRGHRTRRLSDIR